MMNKSDTLTAIQNASLLDDAFLKNVPFSNPGLVAIVRYPDLKIFFVNDSFEYYLGYSNADLHGAGLTFRDLMETYQYDHLLSQLNISKENITSRSSYVIYRLKNKNGLLTSYYLYASPVLNPGDYGELFYLLVLPDLSKVSMPFTSFDSKNMFLGQFKSECFGTFEWVIGVDKIFCSPGVCQIYEIDPQKQDINNLFAKEFVHPNDNAMVNEQIKLALSTDIDLNIEYRIVTGKHNIKTIHCLARSIKNNEGSPVKFAGSIRDVTEQRSIEENLKNKMIRLNQTNRELEEFAYVASHDMQEPLRKITTFSDRLNEKYHDVLSGDGALYLSRIIASAENMRSLINDLLEFSRVSTTNLPFELTDLNNIVRQVKTDLELIIEETGSVISTQPLPAVEAIPSQIKQLFTNIINNGIKFRKPGLNPVIDITVSTLVEPGQLQLELAPGTTYYKIQITDNGIGFDEEYATRIFQVFQRLHGKSEYPGSGIGLAICKKITEYHKGIIYAENLPGKGARFVFILPENQPNNKGNIL